MNDYCLGFVFDDDGKRVLLTRKARPDWQAGCLNGLGGRIEEDEIAIVAMIREFLEEAGVETTEEDWEPFCRMQGPNFFMVCFMAHDTRILEAAATQDPAEPLEVLEVSRACMHPAAISNLRWLIPMALDQHAALRSFFVEVQMSGGS